MKKIFAVICILTSVFVLCACSSTSSTSSTTEVKETTSGEERYYTIEDQTPILIDPDATVVNEPVDKVSVTETTELILGEPVDVDNLRFTLTGISEFVEQYSPDDVTFYDVADAENYSFVLIYFTVLNTGGDAISPSKLNMTIISNGEREHEANRVWFYDADCVSLDTGEKGAWVGTSPKLEVADGEREGLTVFQISDSILESDATLDLIVTIFDNEYVYHIR